MPEFDGSGRVHAEDTELGRSGHPARSSFPHLAVHRVIGHERPQLGWVGPDLPAQGRDGHLEGLAAVLATADGVNSIFKVRDDRGAQCQWPP
jgi:hypothetical protein